MYQIFSAYQAGCDDLSQWQGSAPESSTNNTNDITEQDRKIIEDAGFEWVEPITVKNSSITGVIRNVSGNVLSGSIQFNLYDESGYQLGEAYAQSMGVNIKVFRVVIILLSSILSACVTAFAGPISFVGIAVPFLTRKAFGTSKPIVVIPGTFFIGAVFCMICDLIARMALAPVELNISTVTSILGAPIVIYMMVKREKGRM